MHLSGSVLKESIWPEWLYSFIDTDVSEGVFYYSLWHVFHVNHPGGEVEKVHINIPIGGQPYMRVVVCAG